MHSWMVLGFIACSSTTSLRTLEDTRPPYAEAVAPPGEADRPSAVPTEAAHPDSDRVSDAFLYRDGVIHELVLTLDESSLASLREAPTVDVMAELTVNGNPVLDPVGVHLKGTASLRSIDDKAAFKIDFHQWNPTARFHGVKRLTLNNMVQDPTMLREHAYYWLCRELGVPAPRHGYARIWVNGVEFGLYGIVESFDEQLVDRLWPLDDEGALYEGVGNDFSFRDDDYELQEGIDALAMAPLVELVEQTPPDAWLEMLEANFDFDALLGYAALDIVTGNPDGYALNRNNYYVYGAPLAGKWTLLPSGVDRSFLETGGIRSELHPLEGLLVTGCLADPACGPLLDARIRATADAFDRLDLLDHLTEMERLVGPLCEADPRRELECRSDELLPFVAARAQAIREELDAD
ncbi:MAG: CotH kinase family protein [Pseudomonadota bacterium]|nr:CotH kinase family protein [Pseudomonadota bacterium]